MVCVCVGGGGCCVYVKRGGSEKGWWKVVGYCISTAPTLLGMVALLTSPPHAHGPVWSQVGKHGIIIEFTVGHKSYSATFLPEVAGDRGACCCRSASDPCSYPSG